MFIVHDFDPYIEMPSDITYHVDSSTVPADMEEHWKYWHGMIGEELPAGTVVSLNVDFIPDPTTYFLTIYYPEDYATDGPTCQVDLFHIIREDTVDPIGEGDISEINGSQCGDCGRVNVHLPDVNWQTIAREGWLPENVRPVWRTHPDTVNSLCDPCADKRWAK